MHWVVQPVLSRICSNRKHMVYTLLLIIFVKDMDLIIKVIAANVPAPVGHYIQFIRPFKKTIPFAA